MCRDLTEEFVSVLFQKYKSGISNDEFKGMSTESNFKNTVRSSNDDLNGNNSKSTNFYSNVGTLSGFGNTVTNNLYEKVSFTLFYFRQERILEMKLMSEDSTMK